MGILNQIEASGLKPKLDKALSEYLTDPQSPAGAKISEAIDQFGLRSNEVMKTISFFQRPSQDTGIPPLKPGLYKIFMQMNEELAAAPPPTQPADPSPPADVPEPVVQSQPVAEQVSQEPVEDSADEQVSAESLFQDGEQLTESQEKQLAKALAREEQLMKQRLLKKEQAIRERLLKAAKQRSLRAGGVKPGDPPEVIELKKKKTELVNQKKPLLDQRKALTEQISALSAEIKAVTAKLQEFRPKKSKTVQSQTVQDSVQVSPDLIGQ